jgi:UPF0271 protein
MRIDLNCDMGELDDAQHEAALMQYITSANIACGGHAGDEHTMERTARLALDGGVRIGAHPGYPDRANFGRVEIPMTGEEIELTVYRQIVRLDAVVRRVGGRIIHVKPHGALYNVAVRDADVARAIANAAARWNRSAILFGLAGSAMLEVWSGMGMTVAGEAFADRRYEPDGSLMSRRKAGSLLSVDEAAEQAALLATEGVIVAADGSRIPIAFDTICIHSDMEGAVERLRAVRARLM